MCSDLYTISRDEESPIVNSELQKQMILQLILKTLWTTHMFFLPIKKGKLIPNHLGMPDQDHGSLRVDRT